jgi:hypothetical protein
MAAQRSISIAGGNRRISMRHGAAMTAAAAYGGSKSMAAWRVKQASAYRWRK